MEDLLHGSFFKLVLMFLKWFDCFPKLPWSSSSTKILMNWYKKAFQVISDKTDLFNTWIHVGGHGHRPSYPWLLRSYAAVLPKSKVVTKHFSWGRQVLEEQYEQHANIWSMFHIKVICQRFCIKKSLTFWVIRARHIWSICL